MIINTNYIRWRNEYGNFEYENKSFELNKMGTSVQLLVICLSIISGCAESISITDPLVEVVIAES